jgi:hypothetical protein
MLSIRFFAVSCLVFKTLETLVTTTASGAVAVEGVVAEAVGTINPAARVAAAMALRARLVRVLDGFMFAPPRVAR